MYSKIEYSDYGRFPSTNVIRFTYTLWKRTSDGGAFDPKVYKVRSVRFILSKIKTESSAASITLTVNGASASQVVGIQNMAQVVLSGQQFDELFANILYNDAADINVAISPSSYGIRGGCTAVLEIDLEPNFSASSFVVDSPVAIGSPAAFTISNPNMASIHELKHVITISIPDTAYFASMVLEAGNITQQSNTAYFTIPTAWLPALSDRVETPANAVMETYVGGSLIASYGPRELVLTIPDTYRPAITEVKPSMRVDTSTPDGAIVNGWGIWLQGYSIVSFTIRARKSEDGGAEIRSYRVTCGSETITAESSSLSQTLTMSAPIDVGGNVSYTAVVTDTRGRTATMSSTFNVIPYALPTVRTAREPYRCNNTGVGSEDGAYCACAFDGVVSSCAGKNTMRLQIGLSLTDYGDIPIVDQDVTANELTIVGGSLNAEIGYFVYYIVIDALGNKSAVMYELATEPYAIHVKNGGRGVAFGMVAQRDQCVEINKNWRLMLYGQDIDNVFIRQGEDVAVGNAMNDSDGNKITDTYLKKNGLRFLSASTQSQNITVGSTGYVDVTLNGEEITAGSYVYVTGWHFYSPNAVVMYADAPPAVYTTGGKASFRMRVHNTSSALQRVFLIVYYTIIS